MPGERFVPITLAADPLGVARNVNHRAGDPDLEIIQRNGELVEIQLENVLDNGESKIVTRMVSRDPKLDPESVQNPFKGVFSTGE